MCLRFQLVFPLTWKHSAAAHRAIRRGQGELHAAEEMFPQHAEDVAWAGAHGDLRLIKLSERFLGAALSPGSVH